MIITIDGEKIDYKLEQEKNINEVILSLENWLNNYESLITGIELDGKTVSPADRCSLAQCPIDSVDQINVSTSSVDQMSGENAIEVLEYFERFVAAFNKKDPEIVSADALEGLKWVITSVQLTSSLHGIVLPLFPESDDNIADKFSQLNKVLVTLDSQSEEGRLVYFIDALSGLIPQLHADLTAFYSQLQSRLQENADLSKKIASIKSNFVSLQDAVSHISGDLQTGNEARALGSIQQVAIALDDLFKILSRVESEYSINFSQLSCDHRQMDKWVTDMLVHGREIIEAFNNDDTVLLGDLFEYELKKELMFVPKFLDLVEEKIQDQQ